MQGCDVLNRMNLFSVFKSRLESFCVNNSEKSSFLKDSDPFLSETCGDCSHFNWGDGIIPSDHGSTPICDWGEISGHYHEIEHMPDAESLSPEEALICFYDKEDESGYHCCAGYDGEPPHTESEILSWISERDKILCEILEIKDLAILGEYFFENLAIADKVDPKKLCFGNIGHIQMVQGKKLWTRKVLRCVCVCV